ncbi:MAG: GtrA family protein [Bifidobacteriaceae bacterium]|nr:GtrA family protein [Bifidobacteriaceae bacterium]
MSSLARRGPLASRAALFAWLRELVTFGAVGGVAYLVDAGGYNLLIHGPGHLLAASPVRASLLCGTVSILVAWVGNRYLTFAASRSKAKTRELIMFVLVNIVGIMIASGCLYFSRWILGFDSLFADNLSRNIIGVGLGTIFRYFCYKFIVFTAQ